MLWGRTSIGSLLAVSLLAATLASCTLQTAEEMIETPAADMNLALSDIDLDSELVSDENLSDFGDRIEAELREPMVELNRRMFGGPDRMVWSWVVTYATAPTPTGAYGDLAVSISMKNRRFLVDASSDLCRQFGAAECRSSELAPDGMSSGLVAADLIDGTEQEFGVATNFWAVGESGDTVRGYVVVFREANVIGILEVVGLSETLEQSWVENVARTLEARIVGTKTAAGG